MRLLEAMFLLFKLWRPLFIAAVFVAFGGCAANFYTEFAAGIPVLKAPPPAAPVPLSVASSLQFQAPEVKQLKWAKGVCKAHSSGPEYVGPCSAAAKAGALYFGVSLLLFAFSSAAVYMFGTVVCRCWRISRAAAIIPSMGWAAVAVILGFWFYSGEHLYEDLAHGVLNKTLLQVAPEYVTISVNAAYFLIAVGSASFALGCMLASFFARTGMAWNGRDAKSEHNLPVSQAVAELGRDMASLRSFATVGTLILVTGVTNISLYFDWADPLIALGRDSYQALTDGIVAIYGVTFSAALSVIFYGSFNAIIGAAECYARSQEGMDREQIDKLLAKNGITKTTPEILGYAFATAAPLVAGIFTGGLPRLLGL
ncbi:hypothetical protein [Teichococcus oryzae]|uniref:Uncharacterized protein n=1 Tax=Teichococcus oryzae TaxID=1608942 RepID=A0A5B2TBE8_9PROT|nr:hypothetical protein [Pseudoroseomonas oryzae]KAA2211413.1 hypothetical protein F0Q34_20140 [Pseudoroseomonas oryzae]